jgi:hypothetical protein
MRKSEIKAFSLVSDRYCILEAESKGGFAQVFKG